MKKTMLISQPFGIGDILFIQKVIHHYADSGYNVIVPIMHTLSWMRYYLRPYPNVEYPTVTSHRGKWSGQFKFADIFISLYAGTLYDRSNKIYDAPIAFNGADPETGFIFMPISAAYEKPGAKLMPSKYEFAGLDDADWLDHIHLRRRPHVERELYYDVLGLKDGSRYTLVNEQSSRSALSLPVPGNTVHLRKIDGFTLFDWSMVIERAAQIVTIDTSLVLLAEILKQNDKPLYMISRYDPPSFEGIQEILKLNWNLVPTAADLKVEPVI